MQSLLFALLAAVALARPAEKYSLQQLVHELGPASKLPGGIIQTSQYTDGNCAGSPASNSSVPEATCSSSTMYNCHHNTRLLCVSMSYFSNELCLGGATISTPWPCSACLSMGYGQYARLEGCSLNATTMAYGCTHDCTTCLFRKPVAPNTCNINPVNFGFFSFSTPKPCGTIVSSRSYPTTNCSGEVANFNLFVADQCYGGLMSSSMIHCTMP